MLDLPWGSTLVVVFQQARSAGGRDLCHAHFVVHWYLDALEREYVQLTEVTMSVAIMDEVRLKDVMKTAILEVFEDRREWLTELVGQAMADVAFGYAIQAGERTPLSSRDEVFSILEAAS
jgi:hypothetical protein